MWSTPACLLDHLAAFHLTIDGPGALDYASNLTRLDAATFASTGTTWAYLIGAPHLQTSTDSVLTLVTTSRQADRVAPLVRQYYLPALQELQRFFPEAHHLTVLALDLAPGSFSQWISHPAGQEGLVTVISPRAFDFISPGTNDEYYTIGVPLVQSLLGQSSTLTENIAYFLWIHYQTNGNSEAMQALLENGLPSGASSYYFDVPFAERYRIAHTLYDVYTAAGETTLIDLLHRIQADLDTLSTMSDEQVIAWIEEAVHAD